ncbi:MAG: F0F1 ATP synthase subunit A [Chloroflexi bacterium]|nr:F0F1 ATP synthase subunit A [Chloroflexota bacterium]
MLGGALGAPFGLGFLGAPIAAIELPAERAFSLGSYDVKNSSIMLWIAGLILVFLAWKGTRKIRSGSPEADVPTGLQNFLEVIVEFFINLAESAAGGRHGRRFLPLVISIFLVVVMANWISVLPGVGTIGWVETAEEFAEHREEAIHEAEESGGKADFKDPDLVVFSGGGSFKWIPFGRTSQDAIPLASLEVEADGHGLELARPGLLDEDFDEAIRTDIESHELDLAEDVGILVPYLRGANTDVNTTLAIALVAMVTVQIWGFRSLGFRGYGGKFINIRQGPIFFAVGLLEIIGELARTVSFTFRLFGNMFAGEVLLVAMAFLFPLIGIVPFIGLELFVGVIQAFIFAMLTLVFGVMATIGHGEEEH